MPLTMLKDFLRTESASGVVLMAAAAVALVIANSALAPMYQALLHVPIGLRVGDAALEKDLLHWINDGLMAIFFLLVGLEIKREAMVGELRSLDRALLPAIAAVGGMAAPALIYAAFNFSDAVALRGWAIPAATDIAFAVGVLALLGDRVPPSLRVFLLALAIIDDLGAIVIIALFYTADLNVTALGLAGGALVVLAALNLAGVRRITPYMIVGGFLWVCVLKSGVHATLAGVAAALAVPLGDGADESSPLETLEHKLHPWVAFAIMPIFALANAGVSLSGLGLDAFLAPVPLGIALGLFLGKQLGVFGLVWAAVKAGWCARPQGASWGQVYGVSIITGIGFTMSLFIGNLAFVGDDYAAAVRLGVLSGSLLSAVVGYVVLAALGLRRVQTT